MLALAGKTRIPVDLSGLAAEIKMRPEVSAQSMVAKFEPGRTSSCQPTGTSMLIILKVRVWCVCQSVNGAERSSRFRCHVLPSLPEVELVAVTTAGRLCATHGMMQQTANRNRSGD